MARVLGHRPKKSNHCTFAIRFLLGWRCQSPVGQLPQSSRQCLDHISRLQLAAIPLLDPVHVKQEKVRESIILWDVCFSYTFSQLALQKHFKAKRDHILARLKALHLEVDIPPTSTFYIWLNLERLPAPLNNGLVCPPFTKRLHHLLSNTLDLIDVLWGIVEGKDHRYSWYFLRYQSSAP